MRDADSDLRTLEIGLGFSDVGLGYEDLVSRAGIQGLQGLRTRGSRSYWLGVYTGSWAFWVLGFRIHSFRV